MKVSWALTHHSYVSMKGRRLVDTMPVVVVGLSGGEAFGRYWFVWVGPVVSH